MIKTPELDRAIVEADNAYCNHIGLPKHEFEVGEADRTYARALVAELLRGMERTITQSLGEQKAYIDYGFNAALAEIKRRAGLEDEG